LRSMSNGNETALMLKATVTNSRPMTLPVAMSAQPQCNLVCPGKSKHRLVQLYACRIRWLVASGN
jgi:hypothetical protein